MTVSSTILEDFKELTSRLATSYLTVVSQEDIELARRIRKEYEDRNLFDEILSSTPMSECIRMDTLLDGLRTKAMPRKLVTDAIAVNSFILLMFISDDADLRRSAYQYLHDLRCLDMVSLFGRRSDQ
ncbi:hypothetical protein BGZ70_007077 [Mortierella alpina]|uniref:Uncharacterized protein n=1 Tax=Mortierella alpina TaxID=64518 RepID=A0A9P6J6X8_MORAP|nr:hypothetical protein BGZ70_007077 [Mortierella alpina]